MFGGNMDRECIIEHWRLIQNRWPALFELLSRADLRLSAPKCAAALRLPSVGALERELRRNGLVGFRWLRDWWYVVRFHDDAMVLGSLAEVARKRGDYLSVLTRFMVRATGRQWRQLSLLSSLEIRTAAIAAWTSRGMTLPMPSEI